MKWISVSERMPEEGKEVLVFDKYNNEINAVTFEIGNWGKKDFLIMNCEYPMCKIFIEDITHWMDLPELPKDKQ